MSKEALATPSDDGITVSTPEQAKPEETTNPEPVKAPEEGSALAPDTDAEQAKPSEPELSDAARKAINKKHWQAKEAERKAADLQRRLDELESKQNVSSSEVPEVPPMPDPLGMSDEEFNRKAAERDAVLAQRARAEAQQSFNEQQNQTQQEEARRQQEAENERVRNEYAQKAVGLGLGADEVIQQTVEVLNYGVSDAVAEMISTEADGPLLATYLRQNPDQIDAMRTMTVAQQAIHMSTLVRQGAESLKPRTSGAPPPPTDVQGGGSLNQPDPLLEGVVITTN